MHLEGGTALEFPGDESVWAKLAGDLDALNVIGRGVPQVVQRLGFFVDRRAFRAWLPVGAITDATSAPHLQRRGGRTRRLPRPELDDRVDLLMKRLPEEGKDSFEEMEQIPLAHG